jgi:DNA repair protein RadC
LADVLMVPEDQLVDDPNVGPEAAVAIKSLKQVILEAAFSGLRQRPVLQNKRAMLAYLQWLFGRERVEEARILYLDARCAVISHELIATGTGASVEFSPVIVARLAVRAGAASIVLAHNHPSGDVRPSSRDITTTCQIEASCAGVGIRLLDHVIVAFGESYSFRGHGLLEELVPAFDYSS